MNEARLRALENRTKKPLGTFRGRKIVSSEDWYQTLKGGILECLPERAAPFAELDVWNLPGFEDWLVDYRDLMTTKGDPDFARWSTKGTEAWAWERIRLLIEAGGDWEKVRAENARRSEARLCCACGSSEVVSKYEEAIQEEDPNRKGIYVRTGFREPYYFCKVHTCESESSWSSVADMIEQERRRKERLCAKCGSSDIVMRSDWETSPVEYYCAEETIPKSILSASPETIAKYRRGEYNGYRFTEEAFR